MSIFEKLKKEDLITLKNVRVSKSIYDLIEEVAKKYETSASEIVKTLIENSKQKLNEELNGKQVKSKKGDEK
jgi:hypothetical protein